VPASSPNNQDGWIEWAGTSFSAPIASGLAAIIWCEQLGGNQDYPSSELMVDMVGRYHRHRNIGLEQK
jgi:hypothetical protein